MESKKLQVLAPDPFALRPMTDIALSIANVGLLYVPLLVRAGCSRTSWSQCRSMRNAVDIDNLWALRDENEWLDALNRYWVNPAVCKNRDIEQFMHKVTRNMSGDLIRGNGMTSLTNVSGGSSRVSTCAQD